MLDSRDQVFDQLGPGFTLLALAAQPDAVRAWRDAATALGVPLTVLEDEAQGEAARYGAQLVLVRPDQFVAWSSSDGAVATLQALQLFSLFTGFGGAAGAR
jgi:hypothetical protein